MTERTFKQLSEAEARRALYIDFEGGQDQPPVLLGILRRRGRAADPWVRQIVVDREFAAAGPEAHELLDAVEIVVLRAERRDRRIVSWSEHDLRVVQTLREQDPELVDRFERRYANALAVARRWVNKLHRDERPADGQLAGYLAFIDYDIPTGAGSGEVGDTIRKLRPTLHKGRPLTPAQERRWARLLHPGCRWGHATKVLALYVRDLVLFSRYFADEDVQRIASWLYCPVDSVVMKRLRELGENPGVYQISGIDTPERFWQIQDFLGAAAHRSVCPASGSTTTGAIGTATQRRATPDDKSGAFMTIGASQPARSSVTVPEVNHAAPDYVRTSQWPRSKRRPRRCSGF